MKIKNLLLAGLALIGFSACSNEDHSESQEIGVRGDLAYTSLSVRLADNVFTRSGLKEEPGTKEENAIETMHVVMYASGRVAYLQDFQVKSDGEKEINGEGLSKEEDVTNKIGGFVTKALEVKRQNYDVVVLLNAPTSLLAQVAPGMPYQNLEQAMSKVKASDFMSSGFMMSNAQGVVHLLGSELKDSPESAQSNPLKVQVDRVVAKVQLLVELEKENKAAKVEPKSWIVDITNRHTFPLRQLAPQVGGSYEVVDHKNPQNGTARHYRYAKDPNFSAIDLIGKYHNERLKRLKEDFDYFEAKVFEDKTPGVKEIEGYDYVLENTFEGGENNVVESQTTRVVLKASYIPNQLKFEGEARDQSWIGYSGIPMTRPEFITNAKKALELGWNENIKGLTPSFTNEIKNLVFLSAYLKRESTSSEEVEKYKYLDIVEFKDVAKLHELIDAATLNEDEEILNIKLTAEDIENIGIRFMVDENDEPFTVGNLSYYKDGDNYYPLYIKHFEGLDEKSAYGKYGVVRNNFYRVHVTDIDRPGMAVVTPPVGPTRPSVPTTPADPKDPKPEPENPTEPENPVDTKKIHIAYEVEMLPWVVRDQYEKID